MVDLAKRVGAFLALAGILVGFPVLLLATVGNPVPPGGVDEFALMSDAAVLGLVAVLGWFVWAQLLLCALWEAPPALRRDPHGAARLPVAFAGQQQVMRVLVRTVLAVGATASLLGPGVEHTAAAPVSPAHPNHTVEVHQVADTTTHAPETADQSTDQVSVVTRKGDTLWGLAEKHLGDGFRWQEIAKLNQGRTMVDGRTFSNPSVIEPGWELLLPDDAEDVSVLPHTGGKAATVTVEPGDNLAKISQDATGEADGWEDLYRVNKDTIGSDPNLIQPGQTLRVPGQGVEPTRGGGGVSPNLPEPAPAGGWEVDTPDLPVLPPEEVVPFEGNVPVGGEPGLVTVAEQDASPAEMKALLGAATFLAAGALGLLVTNRRRRFRHRRVGHAVASTPPELVEVEQAINEHGSAALEDTVFVDLALRHVAESCHRDRVPLPPVGAVVLGEEDVALMLTGPASADPPAGWSVSGDGRTWVLPRWFDLDGGLVSRPAPYPALVSVGRDEGGRTWLLDLETLGVCGIGGPSDQVDAVTRFLVCELAVNAWSDGAQVLLTDGFATETVGVNPSRVSTVETGEALARARAVAGDVDEAERNLDLDVMARRRDGVLLDSTHPVVVVVPARPDERFVSEVEGRGRSRVVVVHGDDEDPAVELTGDGSAFLRQWGVTVTAFMLSSAQANLMASELESTRTVEDVPMPAPADDGGALGKYARLDGALRVEYTRPRDTGGSDPASMLPDADEVYMATGATTAADLAEVAPSVSDEVLTELDAVDPLLDEDLSDWADPASPRPKVRLLGPVDVTAAGGADPSSIPNLAGTVSFIAFLACREKGVTGEGAAAAFGWQTLRTVQNRATNARRLLGTRPDGSDWLPDASKSEGARRGAPTYGLVRGKGGVLVDSDLFTRLRFRAQKRGDKGCEDDLLAALGLVSGAPFEAASDRRFPWLFRGDRLDDIMVCAIHDVAHVVATRAVAEGRTGVVRKACEVARLANPHSDVAWLDDAAAAEAEEGRAAADAVVRQRLGEVPDEDLPERTETVLDQRAWLTG